MTEQKFLQSFDELMRLRGFANTTIDDVAHHAGLTRSAFLKRFGSKEGALLVLFERYCDAASTEMQAVISETEHNSRLHSTLYAASQRFEALLETHKASNRAMHEQFMIELKVHDMTKKIFFECVAMMKTIQGKFLEPDTHSEQGAWSAAQLLVTINYNYVLRAMPGLPAEYTERHLLIADLLELALKR